MPSIDRHITRFEELVNYVANCFQSLMVANGAALLACLSGLKDYTTTPAYRGLGILVLLFVIGLIAALVGFVMMLGERMLFMTNILSGKDGHPRWVTIVASFAATISLTAFTSALVLIAGKVLAI